ncbi:hypothetical protein HNY73_007405 [Argiope bruennichi]|uniref:Uncharacterized protein n=1 Tax=Argiope bruennichi TaxID=94029 RepID=A0A8T0FES8_ARGBR|nr:hypothetical protein HNY73_007405 [Argiope bruennichi]
MYYLFESTDQTPIPLCGVFRGQGIYVLPTEDAHKCISDVYEMNGSDIYSRTNMSRFSIQSDNKQSRFSFRDPGKGLVAYQPQNVPIENISIGHPSPSLISSLKGVQNFFW